LNLFTETQSQTEAEEVSDIFCLKGDRIKPQRPSISAVPTVVQVQVPTSVHWSPPIDNLTDWREKPGVLCGGGGVGRRNSRHQWSSGRLDVIRYRADTQPIITDPPSIFLSRKSRNINTTTLVADRHRKSPQKSRRRRRRSCSTASSRRSRCGRRRRTMATKWPTVWVG